MKYLFYGTPDFARTALHALLEAGFPPLAVVTAPDRPSGRGLKLLPSPVKELALQHCLPVLQPEKLKAPDFLAEIQGYRPDFQLVVAFRMLPREVWGMPVGGTWNLHASLLPDLRGAAPIHWALRLGYSRTGLTVFRINEQIDTGDCLAWSEVVIDPSWDAGMLHEVMAERGGALLVDAAMKISEGAYTLIPQGNEALRLKQANHPAPKIHKEDGLLDWTMTGHNLTHFVRAFAPRPGAFTWMEGQRLTLLKANRIAATDPLIPELTYLGAKAHRLYGPGTWTMLSGRWAVKALDEWIEINEVKLQNSRTMSVPDFLRGYRGPTDSVFGNS